MDRLIKYVIIIPTQSTINAEGTARLYLDHVFAPHGLSKSVVSDRDPRITSLFLKEVFSLPDIKFKMSMADHPQTDGLTERVNRIVEDTLRSFVVHRDSNWDLLLPLCQFSVNNSFQASTGESPLFLTLSNSRASMGKSTVYGRWGLRHLNFVFICRMATRLRMEIRIELFFTVIKSFWGVHIQVLAEIFAQR